MSHDWDRVTEGDEASQQGRPPEDSFRQHSCLSLLEKILSVQCVLEEVVLVVHDDGGCGDGGSSGP